MRTTSNPERRRFLETLGAGTAAAGAAAAVGHVTLVPVSYTHLTLPTKRIV